jgi:V/A-type H+-transporting ATPase subunit F
MKIVMFGDEDSIILFHLIGMEGKIHTRGEENFEEVFKEVLDDHEVGIIIITEKILLNHRDYILPIKMQRRSPIIVEIPSIIPEFHEDYVGETIRKYIGIKIS